MYQCGSYCTDFLGNLILGTFMKNLSKKSRFDYNRAKISGTLCEDQSTLFIADDIKPLSKRSLQVN